MRRKTDRAFRVCFASAALAAVLGISGVAWAAVGDPVPSFSLQGLDGNSHSPARYKDKILVLFFIGYN